MQPQSGNDISKTQTATRRQNDASEAEAQDGEYGMGTLWRKGKALWTKFSSIGAETYASSIAFFTFLSLIPLLTLCISLVSLTGIGERDIAEFLVSIVPEAFDDFAKMLIGDAFKGSGIAFSLSTITLLWSASKGIRALHGGLNAAYGVQETRGAVAVAAISVAAALVLGILFAITMYLVFGGAVMRSLAVFAPGLDQNPGALNFLNATFMAVLGVIVLNLCYTYLPAGERRFITQLPGAALASLSCGLFTIGFHIYVDNFCNAEALYGSIATIALFLLWMYLIAYIILAGAFLNRILADRKTGDIRDENESQPDQTDVLNTDAKR